MYQVSGIRYQVKSFSMHAAADIKNLIELFVLFYKKNGLTSAKNVTQCGALKLLWYIIENKN